MIRKVNTYGGYDERWRDGRLYVEYYDVKSYEAALDHGNWTPLGDVTEHERIYLVSAAASAVRRIIAHSAAVRPEEFLSFCPRIARSLYRRSFFAR